jgi:asparagine synthase (glutamine-hydrolysing)
MAGIAFILHRDRRPVPSEELGGVLAALAHRGPDGERVERLGAWALGHRHFWTTPEEMGERQPLAARGPEDGAAVHLAFDGRLDNRAELLAELDVTPAAPSDAALALAAYRRWGEACFERFLGPFAVLFVDSGRRRVVCGRDPLGDRSLVYHLTPELFLCASEEGALLAHPAVPADVDEETVARFFALAPARPGRTFFTGVSELPPGHLLSVPFDGGEARLEAWWHWRVGEPERGVPDAEWAERFGATLRESVRCRLRSIAPPAALMSGGLDSTSVAALAARELAAGGSEAPLATLSWVFDELPGSDEREFMAPVVEALGADPVWIRGDDAWPLRDRQSWPVALAAPYNGLYRRLRERAYRAARTRGASVVLTGECGDQLFFGGADWLRDLLADRRFGAALAGVARELALSGRTDLPRFGLRSALARARGRPLAARPEPEWLTPKARELAGGAAWGRWEGVAGVPRPEQRAGLLDPRIAASIQVESSLAAAEGIEVRRPYRDRRLVELALALPAHQLYRPGWIKWATREAMRGLLPEPVRLRRRRSSLAPLTRRGLVEREAATVRSLLDAPGARWPEYVRKEWLAELFPVRLAAGIDGPAALAAWQCISLELWRVRLEADRFQERGSHAVQLVS